VASNEEHEDDYEWLFWKKRSWLSLRIYPGIGLERFRTVTKFFSQCKNRCWDESLNPEYKTGVAVVYHILRYDVTSSSSSSSLFCKVGHVGCYGFMPSLQWSSQTSLARRLVCCN